MDSFLQLCQQRRSFRKYTDEPIAQAHLDYIVQCALMSPSGHRVNPWRFVVVTDVAILRQMASCRTYGSGMFDTAQAAIVVALDPFETDVWQADGAIAAQNIWLAATDCGLGACWCQVLGRSTAQDENDKEGAEKMIRSLVGLDEGLRVLCVMSLGHKGEERRPFDLEKLQKEKVTYL